MFININVSCQCLQAKSLFLNGTCNNISVICDGTYRSTGGLKKKLDLRSGSQCHKHFVGFFNVPAQGPARGGCIFRETAPFQSPFTTHMRIYCRLNTPRVRTGGLVVLSWNVYIYEKTSTKMCTTGHHLNRIQSTIWTICGFPVLNHHRWSLNKQSNLKGWKGMPKSISTSWSKKGWCNKPKKYNFNRFWIRKILMLSNATNQSKSTVELSFICPRGTLWSTSSDTHQVAEIYRGFYLDVNTILNRIQSTIWIICAFRVLNPHQWSLTKQSNLQGWKGMHKQAEAKRDGVINPKKLQFQSILNTEIFYALKRYILVMQSQSTDL